MLSVGLLRCDAMWASFKGLLVIIHKTALYHNPEVHGRHLCHHQNLKFLQLLFTCNDVYDKIMKTSFSSVSMCYIILC